MLAPTVTARKKNRPRPSADDDSDDDYRDLPTTAKKKRTDMTDYHPGKARRNINGALQAVENKTMKIPMVEPKTDVVSILLQAHMESKKYINSANCFEKQTVLELINKGDIMKESIQDMAFVLDSAVSVYTIRVDRTHGLTMAVKSNVNHGMNNNEPGGKATEEVSTREAKEAKKHAAKQMLGDWKSKFDSNAGERELTPQSDEEEEDAESDSSSEESDETGEEKWLSRVPESIDEFDDFLKGMIHHRRQKNAKLNSLNHFLTDDGDVLNDRHVKNLDANEYYHKAVSRHGEGTIASLLMNNAKCTSDGKAYLLHSRIEEKITTTNYDERVALGFLRGVEATLSNALSEKPVRVQDDLLPPKEVLLDGRDSIDSDEDEPATVRDIDAPSTTESISDETMMQMDHTIAETTMMPNVTILNPSKIVRRKTTVFRGRNMEHMWIPDDTDLGITESIYKEKDELDFVRINNLRQKNELQPEARGRLPAELTMTDSDFNDRGRAVEIAGIADELRDLDCIWNAQIVACEVTERKTEEMMRRAEDLGGSAEEIRARKKRILPPGSYLFFMEPDGGQNPLVPVDQWADEGIEAADVTGGDMDVFFDAPDDDMFGDGGLSPAGSVDNLMMDDDNVLNEINDEERTAQAVRAVMEQNNLDVSFEPPTLDAPSDDIADVPVNPGAVIEAPDEVLRNMGKEDDAHWKGNKPEEATKKDRAKKEKKNEEKPLNLDDYFSLSNEVERESAKQRFKQHRPGVLDKDEKMLFMHRKNLERRPHFAYNYDDFLKPGLTTGGRYQGMSFQKTDAPEQRYNTVTELLANEEESNVDDIVGREWMQLFCGLILREKQDDEASFHSTADSLDGQNQENEDEMEPEDDGGNENDDDEQDDMDSFHSAVQNTDFGSPAPMDTMDTTNPFAMPESSNQIKKKTKNAVHELHEIQREDHDEEDQGEFVYIMDRKVCIKNTTIDQSKTKNCIKSVLTNEMMDLKALEVVAKAEESYEMSVLAGEPDRSILEGPDPLNESFNPLDVTKAIFAPVDEPSQITGSQLKHASDGDSLSNAVVLSDFDIKGTHSMASLMACLPFRAQRLHEKNMHVSLAFSIALQMCNENTLKCIQNKDGSSASGKDEDWMGDFILQNAVAASSSEENM